MARRNPKLTERLALEDLKAGLAIGDVAAAHGLTPEAVGALRDRHHDEIDAAWARLAEDRERRLRLAFEEENERMARLITKTGRVLEHYVDVAAAVAAQGLLQDAAKTGLVTPEGIARVHKQVRETAFQYHKITPESVEDDALPNPDAVPTDRRPPFGAR